MKIIGSNGVIARLVLPTPVLRGLHYSFSVLNTSKRESLDGKNHLQGVFKQSKVQSYGEPS